MSRRTPFRIRLAASSLLGASLLLGWLIIGAPRAAAGQKPQTRRARIENPADWLLGQLESTDWQSSYPAWRAKHPAVLCREFRGDGSSLFIVDLWTYRCTTELESAQATSFFYLLDAADPPTSRLRQFQGEIFQAPRLPISALQRIHDQIEARLTRLYGKPETPDTLPSGIVAFGAADWHLLCIWHRPRRDLYLYLRQSPGQPLAVGLLARDRELQLASTAEGAHLLLDEQPAAEFEDHLDNRLAFILAKDAPGAAALLGDSTDSSDADAASRPGNVLSAITSLLDHAKGAAPDRRAVLLLAADRLTEQWALPATADLPSNLVDQIHRLSTAAGAQFKWDSLGSEWVYQHDLLWTVWRSAPETEWGEDAFFLLLEHGWDTSGVCRSGPDQFRTVIEQGESFLKTYPETQARLPVQFLIAQAYETWWSLSRWAACSPVTDMGTKPCGPSPASAPYQTGAAEARAKAMEIYQSLIAADPQTYGTAALRRHLARLQAGIDTNQRRYFCVYD